ncbi:MAG: restriction endonuclease subunit S, partial [Verrucomicrobiota bacterium]
MEWLGAVPKLWAPKPLKFITEFINGNAFKPSEWAAEGIPIIRIENLNGGDDFNFHKGKIDPRYEVKKNDLLFGWSGNRGTSFGPFLWGRDGKHYLNQHIFRLDGFQCSKRWLYWTLRAVTYYIEEQAHGIIGMVHVTKGKIGGIPIPEISLPEQTQIAAFLDHETAKIDRLIEKQQALIALLKEKRQAVISHAVTKGLNPHAP